MRTLLVETHSYNESLSQKSLSQIGDVSSDLKNQFQHLRAMIAAAKEQYDHRLENRRSLQIYRKRKAYPVVIIKTRAQ